MLYFTKLLSPYYGSNIILNFKNFNFRFKDNFEIMTVPVIE
jgi:hypothetical protein